ncbi:MAG: hypothetical protein QF570_14985 [Myxococcota bacterium]|jgi:hypothetical protein|nr:hypothetical protein [Myxococcota bacterium]
MANTAAGPHDFLELSTTDLCAEGDAFGWDGTADDLERGQARGTSAATANFVDLILTATDMSEDEGEVRDLVDVLYERHHDSLADLREEHQPDA